MSVLTEPRETNPPQRRATSESNVFSVFLLQLFVNDAQMNSSNILCGNGVIHGLSAVLEINRNRCDKVSYQTVVVKTDTNDGWGLFWRRRRICCVC